MVWAIERHAVAEYQPHVRYELVGVVIAQSVRIGIGLDGIRHIKLALNGTEVHRALDDSRIMGNAESNRVNGM